MLENSRSGEFLLEDLSQGELTIWEGYHRDIAESCAIGVKYVDTHMSTLELMGCIKKVRRGSGTAPNIISLIKKPDNDDYLRFKQRSLVSGRLEVRTPAEHNRDLIIRLTNRVSALESRLERLERGLDIRRD